MGSKRSDSEESDSSDGASNWRRGKSRRRTERQTTASPKPPPRGGRSPSIEKQAPPTGIERSLSPRAHRSPSPLERQWRHQRSTSRERKKNPFKESRRSSSRERRRSPTRTERRRSRSGDRLRKKSPSRRDHDRHRSSPEIRRRRDRSDSPRMVHQRDKGSGRERSNSPSVSRGRRRSISSDEGRRPSRHGERNKDGDSRRRYHRSRSKESRTPPRKRDSNKKRKKKSRSRSSSSSTSPDTRKEDPRAKYNDYLEDEHSKKKEDKKKLKALMKETETPEQKRARRLAKKEAKERKRKQEMGWNDELAGYTNQDNPFGDSNLQQTFKWGKKLEKEGMKDIKDEQLEKINRKKREEQRQELEKVKERRLERERERAEREQLLEMEQRKREGAQFDEWARQEDTFHLQQAKLRSKIRIDEGRAKPIDLLARYISAEEEDFSVEMIEPYHYLKGLTLDDFEDLIEDINVYMRLESRKNQEYWNDIRIIVDEEVRKLKKTESDENPSGRQIISSEVNKDIVDVFRGKTPKQLEKLKTSIEAKLKNKGPGLDVAYWETLLSRLRSYMAHARLRERHEENLRKKLAQLKQEQGVEIKPEQSHHDEHSLDNEPQPSSSAVVAAPTQAQPSASSADDDSNSQGADHDIDPLQQSIIEYEQGRYSPTLLKATDLELGTLLIDPREDEQRREARINLTGTGKTEPLTKIDEIFEREARKGMDDTEAQFSVEQLIDAQTYQWSDMYRPRKPRYFNRVHTGFEWNKYNQTHYDIDNPPPKIVQGYKFNIFYPDLIDKNVTPQYSLTACADNPDFSVLRFHAGPPYEDIAFKVVNREWEYSYKKGFRCQFHNDIFQLWFHFKRYRYRR